MGDPSPNSNVSPRASDGPERSRGGRTRSNEAFHRGDLRESRKLFRQKVAKVGPRDSETPEIKAESDPKNPPRPDPERKSENSPAAGSPFVAQKGHMRPPTKREKGSKKPVPGADLVEPQRRSARVSRESPRSIDALGPLLPANDRMDRADSIRAT